MKHIAGRLVPSLLGTAALAFGLTSQTLGLPAKARTEAPETLGGGTVADPAVGPAPSFGLGGPGMVLVKNWHFGTGGTIKNQADMNAEFQYHDQFGTFCNGFGNYGADTVAPDQADAINGQPVEGKDSPPVRQFTAGSLRTFLTPLDGATLMDPNKHNTGCGSFVAKWKIPRGGLLLGRDIVWETRVRYKTPPYYWFGIWTCGNKWKWDGRAQGAEMDVVESFGYDNGGGGTNFDGRYWHSSAVANPYKDTVFYADWTKTMAQQGVRSYDASQYHIWTWVYKRDNSYAMFVDGIKVQAGSNYYWTFGNTAKDEPVDVDFLFDGGWGTPRSRAWTTRCRPRPLTASSTSGATAASTSAAARRNRPSTARTPCPARSSARIMTRAARVSATTAAPLPPKAAGTGPTTRASRPAGTAAMTSPGRARARSSATSPTSARHWTALPTSSSSASLLRPAADSTWKARTRRAGPSTSPARSRSLARAGGRSGRR